MVNFKLALLMSFYVALGTTSTHNLQAQSSRNSIQSSGSRIQQLDPPNSNTSSFSKQQMINQARNNDNLAGKYLSSKPTNLQQIKTKNQSEKQYQQRIEKILRQQGIFEDKSSGKQQNRLRNNNKNRKNIHAIPAHQYAGKGTRDEKSESDKSSGSSSSSSQSSSNNQNIEPYNHQQIIPFDEIIQPKNETIVVPQENNQIIQPRDQTIVPQEEYQTIEERDQTIVVPQDKVIRNKNNNLPPINQIILVPISNQTSTSSSNFGKKAH